jgi:hypothetical protein
LGIQTQAGDAGDRLLPIGQAPQKLQRHVAAIDNQHQRTLRQPAPKLQSQHLAAPIDQSLVALLPFLNHST